MLFYCLYIKTILRQENIVTFELWKTTHVFIRKFIRVPNMKHHCHAIFCSFHPANNVIVYELFDIRRPNKINKIECIIVNTMCSQYI